MLINNNTLCNFIYELSQFIEKKKTDLIRLNRTITLDTQYWVEDDFRMVKRYLKNYTKNYNLEYLKNRIKPKGEILIILSYNEPFILSIIPILNALVAGNKVIVKPSHYNYSYNFVDLIWNKSGLVRKYKLDLEIIRINQNNSIEKIISRVKAVYFFGSYKVAKEIAKICGNYYVEFYPEVETSDCKIYYKQGKNIDIENDVNLTLEESFNHSGQTCQRIQGVYIHTKIYSKYVNFLKKKFIEFCSSEELKNYIDEKYILNRKKDINKILIDIKKARPDEIIKIKKFPLLVINPDKNSDFIQNAYFLPVLWTVAFDRKEELIKLLNSRKFFLGINIQSDCKKFTNFIIKNTKFTRYTINTTHTNIRNGEGWGGAWPSGYTGYKDWIYHFANSYIEIKDP